MNREREMMIIEYTILCNKVLWIKEENHNNLTADTHKTYVCKRLLTWDKPQRKKGNYCFAVVVGFGYIFFTMHVILPAYFRVENCFASLQIIV